MWLRTLSTISGSASISLAEAFIKPCNAFAPACPYFSSTIFCASIVLLSISTLGFSKPESTSSCCFLSSSNLFCFSFSSSIFSSITFFSNNSPKAFSLIFSLCFFSSSDSSSKDSSEIASVFSNSISSCVLGLLIRPPNNSSRAEILASSSFIFLSKSSFSNSTFARKVLRPFSKCHSVNCFSGSIDNCSGFSISPAILASCSWVIFFSISTSISRSPPTCSSFTDILRSGHAWCDCCSSLYSSSYQTRWVCCC